MSVFGLDRAARAARAGKEPAAPFSPGVSALRGALAFGAVSTLAYGIWAFGLLPYGIGMYAAIAVVYLGLGGLALAGLVAGQGVVPRVTALFAAAFLAYAVVWCVFWFGLRGKHHADLWGRGRSRVVDVDHPARVRLQRRRAGGVGGPVRLSHARLHAGR